MKKILILISFIIAAVLLISGYQDVEPEDKAPEKQSLITQYTGIINEVNDNEMLVYIFVGYNGEMVARQTKKQ